MIDEEGREMRGGHHEEWWRRRERRDATLLALGAIRAAIWIAAAWSAAWILSRW